MTIRDVFYEAFLKKLDYAAREAGWEVIIRQTSKDTGFCYVNFRTGERTKTFWLSEIDLVIENMALKALNSKACDA